ncbi:hypothetical protein R0J89_14155, partial [Psychrobacter sp. SIMBA_152]
LALLQIYNESISLLTPLIDSNILEVELSAPEQIEQLSRVFQRIQRKYTDEWPFDDFQSPFLQK